MNPLQQIERDLLQQAQEWARLTLEQQLQKQAEQVAMVCPKSGERLSNTRWRKMTLRTVSGTVRLRVKIGYSQLAQSHSAKLGPPALPAGQPGVAGPGRRDGDTGSHL